MFVPRLNLELVSHTSRQAIGSGSGHSQARFQNREGLTLHSNTHSVVLHDCTAIEGVLCPADSQSGRRLNGEHLRNVDGRVWVSDNNRPISTVRESGTALGVGCKDLCKYAGAPRQLEGSDNKIANRDLAALFAHNRGVRAVTAIQLEGVG